MKNFALIYWEFLNNTVAFKKLRLFSSIAEALKAASANSTHYIVSLVNVETLDQLMNGFFNQEEIKLVF